MNYQGEQLDEDTEHVVEEISHLLYFSQLSSFPTKWRWDRCGVTQPLLVELTPICARPAQLNVALHVDRSEMGTS